MRAVVVGAGAIGLFCALRLVERGAEVLVLEAEHQDETPTRTASRAAAGMLGPLSEALIEREGAHPRLIELGLASLQHWRTRGPQISPTTFPARGAKLVGFEESALSRLKMRAESSGAVAQWRNDALLLPDEGAVDANLSLQNLERLVAVRGGEVRRGVSVAQCEARAVVADGDRIEADVVLLAVGAWSAALSPALSALTPTKGQILEVESYALRPGETLRAPDVYIVSRAAGRLIIGATMEFGARDLETDRATIEALHARAARWLPDVADAPILRAWAGVRPMTEDWAPRIGWRDGVLVASGHSRNGWLLAPITAEIVSAYAHGEPIPDLWASFAP